MKRMQTYKLKLERQDGLMVSDALFEKGAVRKAGDLAEIFRSFIGEDAAAEHFAAIALDARRKPLGIYLVSQGSMTQAMAHPREVFAPALMLGAAAIAIAHNHPSGDPGPSDEDHALTRRIREAGQLLAIPVLDHVIIGEAKHFSYAEQGWPRA